VGLAISREKRGIRIIEDAFNSLMENWVDSSPWFLRGFRPKDDKIQGWFLLEVVAGVLPYVGCIRGDMSSFCITSPLSRFSQIIGFLVTIILCGDS
jgi:hypothetical protein